MHFRLKCGSGRRGEESARAGPEETELGDEQYCIGGAGRGGGGREAGGGAGARQTSLWGSVLYGRYPPPVRRRGEWLGAHYPGDLAGQLEESGINQSVAQAEAHDGRQRCSKHALRPTHQLAAPAALCLPSRPTPSPLIVSCVFRQPHCSLCTLLRPRPPLCMTDFK